MRYYRTIAHIALILLGLCPNGCGGGKGFTPQLGTAHLQQPGGPYLPGNQHIPWTGVGRSASDTGLRKEQHFTYDYSTYPSAQGFTVVPMLDEQHPKPAGSTDYLIRVEPDKAGSGRVVTLIAKNNDRVLAHLRFDPQQWDVTGTASLNCWLVHERFPACGDCRRAWRVAELQYTS
jgi:hypothetical protein